MTKWKNEKASALSALSKRLSLIVQGLERESELKKEGADLSAKNINDRETVHSLQAKVAQTKKFRDIYAKGRASVKVVLSFQV